MKTVGVGVSAHALVDETDLGARFFFKKDRYELDGIAAVMHIAENVSACERNGFE
jgi:hypothetical protein